MSEFTPAQINELESYFLSKKEAKRYLNLAQPLPLQKNLRLGQRKIIEIADPTDAQDAATKSYVDSNLVTDHGGLSGLTDDDHTQYCKLVDLDTSDVTVSNTTDETTVYTFTLPGGTLNTGNMVKIHIPWDTFDIGVGQSIRARLTVGSTHLDITLVAQGSFTGLEGFIEAAILAAGSTSSQDTYLKMAGGETEIASDRNSVFGQNNSTASEDSSGNLTIAIKLKFDTTGNAITTRNGYCVAFRN